MMEPLEGYSSCEEDLRELEALTKLCKQSSYSTIISLMHWLTDYLQHLYDEATE